MPRIETALMSIATRPTGPDLAPGPWDAGERTIGTSQPPGVLLPAGGVPAPAPAPMPARALARDALKVLRVARLGTPAGSPWHEAASSPEVDTIRRHLQPIRTRRALADSYGREAFHDVDRDRGAVVCLAYVLRWLELGPDRA
jgi:hypothetical protein